MRTNEINLAIAAVLELRNGIAELAVTGDDAHAEAYREALLTLISQTTARASGRRSDVGISRDASLTAKRLKCS